jgi:hypothetical protein
MLQHTARATYCTIQHTSCISVQTYAIGTFHYIFQRDSTTTVPASTYADAYRPCPLLRSAWPVGQSYSLLWEHLSIIHTGTYYVRYAVGRLLHTYLYVKPRMTTDNTSSCRERNSNKKMYVRHPMYTVCLRTEHGWIKTPARHRR